MAQAIILVLKNAAAANVNYFPKTIATGVKALYQDRTQGVIALQPTASMSFRESSTVRTVSGKLVFPVLNATTGVIDTCLGKFEFVMPLKLEAVTRQEILARTRAMIIDTVITDAAVNGETPW